MEHVGGDVGGLAGDLVSPTGVVADASDNGANITPGHGDGLAVVEGLDGGEEVGVLLDNVGELVHESAAVLGGGLLPGGVEGLAGGGDGEVYILLGGLADGGDDLFGRGVDDFKLLLVNPFDPLVVDEPVVGEKRRVLVKVARGGGRGV